MYIRNNIRDKGVCSALLELVTTFANILRFLGDHPSTSKQYIGNQGNSKENSIVSTGIDPLQKKDEMVVEWWKRHSRSRKRKKGCGG